MKEIKKSASFTSKQRGKDVKFNIDLNYSPEYDSFIIKVKEGEGFMAYSSNIERMPLKVIQKLNEMLEEVLIQAGSDYEMKEHKMFDGGKVDSKLTENEVEKIAKETAKALGSKFSVTEGTIDNGSFDLDYDGVKYDGGSYIVLENGDVKNVAMPKKPIVYNYKTKNKYEFGGDFQAGVYAKGGSLEAHGIEVGDTFVKTIMGGIQKVKDKNGKIVYINLSTGERDSQPPLPFENGGGVDYEYDDIAYAKTKAIQSIDWDKELREYAGSEYSKLTAREKEQIISDMQRDWNSRHSNFYSKGGGVGIEEDIDMEDDKRLRVRKPAMPEKKLTQQEWAEKHNAGAYEYMDKKKFKTGGLVGNQKRIDLNKNGKIDAEDFKLLRSSMNGAWRNERKHVNHNEDYEVRYAKPRPSRTGYKGKRKFEGGGGISNFERLSRVVAKNYEGKRVKPQYQKEYGKVYSKEEAKEVGNKVAGKVKLMRQK